MAQVSSAPIGYSIWCIPDAPQHSACDELIGELSATHGTVRFPPHITLLGDIWPACTVEEMRTRTERLASAMEPLTVKFARAAAGEMFYRCVYALCNEEPALVAANKAAQSEFGHNEVFMPHLSLLYSDCDREAREAVRAGVDGRVKDIGGVTVRRIELWDTTGRCEEWKMLQAWTLPFSSQQQ